MPNSTPDEGCLIRRLQTGDLGALGELYELHRDKIYRTALAITHDPSVAEDILHETFLRLYTHAEHIDTALPLSPWLYRVAVNLSYSWYTRRQRYRLPLDDVIDKLIAPLRHSPEPSTEHKEMRHRVREAIDTLCFNQRVVIVLYYLNDMSVREIADVLECPVGTVKSRLYYGREALREKLGKMVFVSDTARGFT
jgi:RNA polymerase sigma-70 factor (ECF subfamily)